MDVKSTWIPTWHRMDHVHGHLDYFQKPSLGGRPTTKLGDHDTLNAHNHCFILFYQMCKDPHEKKIIEMAFVEGPVTYDFTLHLRIRDHTT
jgi:hypothetical protein